MMSNLVFTVKLRNTEALIKPGIEVSNLIVNKEKKTVLPFVKLKNSKSSQSLFVRVSFDNQLWENWKKSGYQGKILRARLKDSLPKALMSSSLETNINREQAIVLLEGMRITDSSLNVIAWTRHKSDYDILVLVKKNQAIRLGNKNSLLFDGYRLKKLVEK